MRFFLKQSIAKVINNKGGYNCGKAWKKNVKLWNPKLHTT